MRVLAVDFGEKRMGLAVSDESGALVVPVGAVARTNDAQAAAEVAEAALSREVTRIVVGYPRSASGIETSSATRARNFARRLHEVSGLPVDLHDESLTTVAAESSLRELGLPPARRALARDAEAAAAILRDYLSVSRDLP